MADGFHDFEFFFKTIKQTLFNLAILLSLSICKFNVFREFFMTVQALKRVFFKKV